MDINNLIDEILKQSIYLGCFSFDELLHYSAVHSPNGVGISKDGAQTFLLAMSGGEPAGAILVDEKGTLFGDKAVYLLQGTEQFHLYQVAPQIVDTLVSRCRVYNKSHLKNSARFDIPTIGGGTKQRVGVLCLTIRKQQVPLAGVHVSIRKGKRVLSTEVTDRDGRVCFRLLNGRYVSVVTDRTGELTRFAIDFYEPQAESVVDIGGKRDEDR